MNLLIRQYLAALKERRELDAILPDLLLQLGFQVYSRPGIGTRQHGVDVAAVGYDDDGQKKVFLFSIKAGDLNRATWGSGNQALRQSLNEILDGYIGALIPPRFRGLPIVICPCWGGSVDETVQQELNGYYVEMGERYKHRSVSFESWDGDKLAKLISTGFMREELMPAVQRSHLRKAIALLEEADSSFDHFSALVNGLFDKANGDPKALETVLRQMTLCLWILFGWAVEAGNLDAPQRASELVLLRAWRLTKQHIQGTKKFNKSMNSLLNSAFQAYLAITNAYVEKIEKGAGVINGLGSSVHASSHVDVNLKLFDIVGRLSCFGWWQYMFWRRETDKATESARTRAAEISKTRDALINAIENNRVLYTPLTDDQAIDINIACLFLQTIGEANFVVRWTSQMSVACVFAHMRHDHYPSLVREYRDLLSHPKLRTDAYRKKATEASILYPMLAVWASINGDSSTAKLLADFVNDELLASNLQVMLPDIDTEEHLYTDGKGEHGTVLGDLRVTADGVNPLAQIREEVEAEDGMKYLSPPKFSLHALVFLACRFQRIPVPPQYWLYLSDAEGKSGSTEKEIQ